MGTGNSAFADGGTTSWGIDDEVQKPLDVEVTITDMKSHQKQMLQSNLKTILLNL